MGRQYMCQPDQVERILVLTDLVVHLMDIEDLQTTIVTSLAEHHLILSLDQVGLLQGILIAGRLILRLATLHHLHLLRAHLILHHLTQGLPLLRQAVVGRLPHLRQAADLRLLQVEMFVRVNNNLIVI